MLGPFATASRFTLPFTRCRYTPPAHRCLQQRRQRVTEGTAMAPWNGPNYRWWWSFCRDTGRRRWDLHGAAVRWTRSQISPSSYIRNTAHTSWNPNKNKATVDSKLCPHSPPCVVVFFLLRWLRWAAFGRNWCSKCRVKVKWSKRNIYSSWQTCLTATGTYVTCHIGVPDTPQRWHSPPLSLNSTLAVFLIASSWHPSADVRNRSLVSGSWTLKNDTDTQTNGQHYTAADHRPTNQVSAWQARRGSRSTRPTCN